MLTIGWAMMFIAVAAIFLLAGYVVQVIIAVQGFLSKGNLFGAKERQATMAAWATSLAFIAVGIFFPDGTDAGYGSTFQKWLGSYGPNAQAVHQATDSWAEYVAVAFGVVWIGAFIWLVVLWAEALKHRRTAPYGKHAK